MFSHNILSDGLEILLIGPGILSDGYEILLIGPGILFDGYEILSRSPTDSLDMFTDISWADKHANKQDKLMNTELFIYHLCIYY